LLAIVSIPFWFVGFSFPVIILYHSLGGLSRTFFESFEKSFDLSLAFLSLTVSLLYHRLEVLSRGFFDFLKLFFGGLDLAPSLGTIIVYQI
jgi:hypothetical protein